MSWVVVVVGYAIQRRKGLSRRLHAEQHHILGSMHRVRSTQALVRSSRAWGAWACVYGRYKWRRAGAGLASCVFECDSPPFAESSRALEGRSHPNPPFHPKSFSMAARTEFGGGGRRPCTASTDPHSHFRHVEQARSQRSAGGTRPSSHGTEPQRTAGVVAAVERAGSRRPPR